jgi:hypothetical protein
MEAANEQKLLVVFHDCVLCLVQYRGCVADPILGLATLAVRGPEGILELPQHLVAGNLVGGLRA